MKNVYFVIFLFFAFSAHGVVASDRDLSINPELLQYPALDYKPPKTERAVLENGIVLHIFSDHEIPLIRMSAIFSAGSIYDPPGKEGLAELSGAVMRTGGTRSISGEALDDELDFRSAVISVSTSMEFCSAAVSMHRKDAERITALFADLIRHPGFSEKRLSVQKSLECEKLLRILDEPQKLANREFRRLLYYKNPRGNLATIASISKISRQDLIDFHEKNFHPGNLMLSITGDITKEEAISMAERYFGTWPISVKNPEPPVPEAQSSGSLNLLRKTFPQSTVLIGYIVPGRDSRDFYTLTLLDFILGSGGFRSKLMQEIRNERGLAYSAGGFYAAKRGYGVLEAYAMTKCSSTSEVLGLARKIIEDLRKYPLTDRELTWAKRALVNKFIFSLERSDQIAMQHLMVELEGAPSDFLASFQTKINQVTVRDIQDAAMKYLSPEKAVVLVVGDELQLESSLSRYGKVTTIDWKDLQ